MNAELLFWRRGTGSGARGKDSEFRRVVIRHSILVIDLRTSDSGLRIPTPDTGLLRVVELTNDSAVPTVTITARGIERLASGHLWIYRSDIANAAGAEPGVVRLIDKKNHFWGQALYSANRRSLCAF